MSTAEKLPEVYPVEISVVLPIYNEVESIQELIFEIEQVLDPLDAPYEVVAVNDGSTDGTDDLIDRLASEKPYLKIIHFRANAGQAAAFDAGFAYAQGKYVVTMDADRQNDPADIPKMLPLLEEGYDVISGWRRDRQDPIIRKIPSKIANYMIRKVTGTKVNDLGCSLKIYKQSIARELRLYGEMHRFLIPLAEQLGANVGEYVVNHRPREAGISKYGFSRIFKVVLDLLTVWFMGKYSTKPIYIFGGVGSGLIGLSSLLTLFVGYEKIIHGYFVHKNPLFLIAIMFLLIGVQLIGLGLLAEVIVRTYFESQNKDTYTIKKTINLE